MVTDDLPETKHHHQQCQFHIAHVLKVWCFDFQDWIIHKYNLLSLSSLALVIPKKIDHFGQKIVRDCDKIYCSDQS